MSIKLERQSRLGEKFAYWHDDAAINLLLLFRFVWRIWEALTFMLWVWANSRRGHSHCFSVISLLWVTSPTGARLPSDYAERTRKPSSHVGIFNRRHEEE